MAESECEIEYLDEDAELVQKCFQATQVPEPYSAVTEPSLGPLLVERPVRKRRRKKDDDSDYDPREDYAPPSPPTTKTKKRKSYTLKRQSRSHAQEPLSNLKSIKKILKENKILSPWEQFLVRKKLNIIIPDYDDPLCLPVKAVKKDSTDLKRLNVWNNVCLEHFKNCDKMLRPEQGEIKGSSRSVVLRNVVNKQSGKIETTIWSKTSVENEEGDKKSEIFQCVLPKYMEKVNLKSFSFSSRRPKPFRTVDEVILTKEEHDNGEALVIYKPKDSVSSLYMLYNKSSTIDGQQIENTDDKDSKMYIKEMACTKVCAHCYQCAARKVKVKKTIICPICTRSFTTVKSILEHFKTHSVVEVQRYRKVISAALAEIVEHNYKCRICSEKFDSVKKLRTHVPTHQGSEQFVCEVGNHLAN